MDYEKKYKEALSRARSIIEDYKNRGLNDILFYAQEDLSAIFSELKMSEDESIIRDIRVVLESSATRIFKENGQMPVWYDRAVAWLEKQGEQKPADKVGPKFTVGDWVVNTITDNVEQIIEVTSNEYICSGTLIVSFDNQHLLKKWTIQDAKDGDVLVNWNNTTFIFKTIEDETVKFYIAYNEKWDEIKTPSSKLSHLGLPEPQFEFHPSTKEQRDLLFQKMKETGYEWDKEKKEVKKIEPKTTAWTPMDEQRVENLLAIIEGHGYPGEVAWLNSLKDRVQSKQDEQKSVIVPKFREGDIIKLKDTNETYEVSKIEIYDADEIYYHLTNGGCICENSDNFELVEQKLAEWSEEDECIIEEIEAIIDAYVLEEYNPKALKNWLKSLKDRVLPQSKQEWSNWDKTIIESIEALCDEKIESVVFQDVKEHVNDIKDWLKFLKKRVQLQPEWSEEDEQLYNDLSDTYFYNDEDYPEETYKRMLKRVLDWMNKRAKFFRPLENGGTWKPSLSQLNALGIVAKGNAPDDIEEINSLYKDLKKLI